VFAIKSAIAKQEEFIKFQNPKVGVKMKIICGYFPPFEANVSNLMITGGDRRFIEISKRLIKLGAYINIIATPTGAKFLQKEELHDAQFDIMRLGPIGSNLIAFFLRFNWNLHILISYFFSILLAFKKISSSPHFDIFYSPSDFPTDTITAFLYKKMHKGSKWVAVTYQRIPYPWERPGNFFMNSLSFAAQQFSYRLFKSADLVLVNETQEGAYVKNLLETIGVSSKNIVSVKLGVDVDFISQVQTPQKVFDACFVAALGPARGLYDIVPVWKMVTEVKKDARLAVIGKGSAGYELALKKEIDIAGLDQNISMLGYLRGSELYEAIKSSKVFVSLNREGSWGIGICEGMACGLPVIAYDLKAYSIYSQEMIKVPRGDVKAFAITVLNLFKNPDLIKKLGQGGQELVKNMDWNSIACTEFMLLSNLF
jgi:glycosyltransferase involved in cell wall biosynthesis